MIKKILLAQQDFW